MLVNGLRYSRHLCGSLWFKEKETAKMEVWFSKQRVGADTQQNGVQVYPRSSSTLPDANKLPAEAASTPHRRSVCRVPARNWNRLSPLAEQPKNRPGSFWL